MTPKTFIPLLAGGVFVLALSLTPAVGAGTSAIAPTCSRQEQGDAMTASDLALIRPYVSKFSGIAFCAPAAWSIEIEDESIFLAPSEAHQFWENAADADETYYSIGRVSPFLSPEDASAGRTRTALEIARSTANALMFTQHMKIVELKNVAFANSRDSASLLMGARQRFQYQVIIYLESGRIVTVSVNGRREDQRRSLALVDAIARTIRPLSDDG